ncbi:MAG TPA: PPC domain-containing DNA-binding protein, partial [Anaerolineales bacterium]|nr:PPC domain-containing DNA-binding protein [Anaerolineales bacterium]
ESKLIFENNGLKTYVLIYEKGDEFISGLQTFAEQRSLNASHFTAIGAFSDAVVGFFDRQVMDYKKKPVKEQVEVLTLLGNITLSDGEYKVHAHAVLGKADASAMGGHILEGHVWPTLEVIVEESPKHLLRRKDPETGLPLLELKNS